MDAAIPVDPKTAPTGIWNTAQTAVYHSVHTHHRFYEEERRAKRPEPINLSTDSDQVHLWGRGYSVAERQKDPP
jgi:hypothetical protein